MFTSCATLLRKSNTCISVHVVTLNPLNIPLTGLEA